MGVQARPCSCARPPPPPAPTQTYPTHNTHSLILLGEAALEVARCAQHRHDGTHAIVIVVLQVHAEQGQWSVAGGCRQRSGQQGSKSITAHQQGHHVVPKQCMQACGSCKFALAPPHLARQLLGAQLVGGHDLARTLPRGEVAVAVEDDLRDLRVQGWGR